jgi:hypothetical protein
VQGPNHGYHSEVPYSSIPSALSAKAQEGKKVGEIDEPLSFAALGIRQGLTLVLSVEQRVQALLHTLGQPEPRQIVGHFDLALNYGGHELGLSPLRLS